MTEPKISWKKYRLMEDEKNGCTFCGWGSPGDIVWRMEINGFRIFFHWRLCNKCRFFIFSSAGGKRLKGISIDNPKKYISDSGRVYNKKLMELSWDRQEAIFNGESLQQYESRMFAEMDKKREANNKSNKSKDKDSKSKKKFVQGRLV